MEIISNLYKQIIPIVAHVITPQFKVYSLICPPRLNLHVKVIVPRVVGMKDKFLHPVGYSIKQKVLQSNRKNQYTPKQDKYKKIL